MGDANLDAAVNILDLGVPAGNYSRSGSGGGDPGAPTLPTGRQVPGPVGVALLCGLSWPALVRRRRGCRG